MGLGLARAQIFGKNWAKQIRKIMKFDSKMVCVILYSKKSVRSFSLSLIKPTKPSFDIKIKLFLKYIYQFYGFYDIFQNYPKIIYWLPIGPLKGLIGPFVALAETRCYFPF